MSEAVTLTRVDLRQRLAEACDMAGGQSRWAEMRKLPRSTVSDILSGRRDPSDQVLAALGLMRVTRYAPITRGANG